MSDGSDGCEEVRQLFTQQIPELVSGTLQIKAIARERGFRTMLVTCSSDETLDPVGSFVGERGARVKAVVRSINEPVDVIRWSESPEELIKNTFAPAKIAHLKLDAITRTATVYAVEEHAGRILQHNGKRLELVCRLLGWNIHVKEI
jgi:transcription termination/antitermination protein NusA